MAHSSAVAFTKYHKLFETEEACYRYLYKMKWPEGYRCSKCRHDACYAIKTRNYPLYECKNCEYQTTLTVGTIFEKTRTDLTLWFAAIFFLYENQNVSTASIASELDIDYRTAHAMVRKIRAALANPMCIAAAPSLEGD